MVWPQSNTNAQLIQALHQKSQALGDSGNKYRDWATSLDACGHEIKKVVCERCGWTHTIKKKCGLRSCPSCSSWKAFRTQKRYLKKIQTWKEPKFWTLTLRSSESPGKAVWRLQQCLTKLRRRASVKRCIRAGIYAIESGNPVQVNGKTFYNIHCHLLIDAGWRPKEWLSKLWLEITGDSWIVDVKWVRNPKHQLKYILEYLSKGPANVKNPWPVEAVIQFMDELEGKRLVQVFGALLGSAERKPDFCCEDCGGMIFRIVDAITGTVEFSEWARLRGIAMKLGP